MPIWYLLLLQCIPHCIKSTPKPSLPLSLGPAYSSQWHLEQQFGSKITTSRTLYIDRIANHTLSLLCHRKDLKIPFSMPFYYGVFTVNCGFLTYIERMFLHCCVVFWLGSVGSCAWTNLKVLWYWLLCKLFFSES